MEENRGFGTRIGYIMSMAGFCIGIGNMWKFPYMVGANGGGAFLIIYLACVLLIGVPLFLIEVQLGRSSQLSGIAGMRLLAPKKKGFWSGAIGWVAVITVFLICCYFWTIMGWNVGYIGKVASGSLYGLDNAAIVDTFANFSGSWGCVACIAGCAIFSWLMMNTDFKKGVEKLCTFAMPALFILLIGLAIYSNTLPGSNAGLRWYLVPDFSDVDILAVVQAAAVQVFYSIGVGMCCGFVYGSYIKKDANMVVDTSLCGLMDTAVATLSGLVITPALFAFGIEPASGPSLIFISLPQMFTSMGNVPGRIFGVLFLLAIFLACITSMVGVLECMVANMCDAYGWTRRKANNIVISVTFILSVIVTLNQGNGILANLKVLGMDIFSFFDCVSSAFGLALGALMMWVFAMFVWGFKKFQAEANSGATGKIRIWNWMKWYYYIPLPIILVFVIYCIMRMYFG